MGRRQLSRFRSLSEKRPGRALVLRLPASGQMTLGYRYKLKADFDLVAQDPVVAIQLYGHAAERGLRAAQVRFGLALIEGKHVAQNALEGAVRRMLVEADQRGVRPGVVEQRFTVTRVFGGDDRHAFQRVGGAG